MATELATPASEAEAPLRHESLVDENLEFMARLSLIEQALPLLRMRGLGRIAEAVLSLLCAEAGAPDGVIWGNATAGESLELLATRGNTRVAEEPRYWSDPRVHAGEALHSGRVVRVAAESGAAARVLVPCGDGDQLLAVARLSGWEAGSEPSERVLLACEKIAEIGTLAFQASGERRESSASSVRDPETDLPTCAFLEEVAKTELPKARRFGRRISLVCLDLEGADPRRHKAELASLVACASHTIRTTDILAIEEPNRFWLWLTDSDPLGGAVLKRRIHDRLREALSPSATEIRPALGLATFPRDGESLAALRRHALDRIRMARTSIVRDLGIEADTSLAAIVERLREQATTVSGEVVSEAADLLVGELSCRPRDQGLLFFAPGQDSAAFLRPLIALGEADVATDVFLATDEDTLPAGSVVSALGLPPQVSADTSWIVRFGEAPPYALLAWPRQADGSRPVFHTSDPVLVEHMTFRLRAEVGFGMRA